MKTISISFLIFFVLGIRCSAQVPNYKEIYLEVADYKFDKWIRMYSYRSGIGYEQGILKKIIGGVELNYYKYQFPYENYPPGYGYGFILKREIMQAKIRFSYSDFYKNKATYYKAGIALGYAIAKEDVISNWVETKPGNYITIIPTNTYQGISLPIYGEYYVRLSKHLHAGLGLEISFFPKQYGIYAFSFKTGYSF